MWPSNDTGEVVIEELCPVCEFPLAVIFIEEKAGAGDEVCGRKLELAWYIDEESGELVSEYLCPKCDFEKRPERYVH